MKNIKIIISVFIIILSMSTAIFAEEIKNFEALENNGGENFHMSKGDRYELLENGVLFTWKVEYDSDKGAYIPLKDIKDCEGNEVDIKKFFDIYTVDFDGDGTDELCVFPTSRPIWEDNEDSGGDFFYDSYLYRATILKKIGNEYVPYKASSIDGEYFYISDIRDLNGDGLMDMILSSGAGASSYCDISEIFYFNNNSLQSQVFSQWISIYDFYNDGIYELAVYYPEGVSSAHAFWASWGDIWEWAGRDYRENSRNYPQYYENIYIPDMINQMIYCSGIDPYLKNAVKDRVFLVEKAWKIVLDNGLCAIKDEVTAREENSLGLDSINKDDLKKAIYHFQKAVKLNPRNPEYTNNLGYVYELSGEYDTAADFYCKTLARTSDRAVAWYNLGCVIGQNDNIDDVKGCFYNYILFAPDRDNAIKAIKDLSENGKLKITRDGAKEVCEEVKSEEVKSEE